MRCFFILLCLIFQVELANEDIQFRAPSQDVLIRDFSKFPNDDTGLSPLDVILVFFCFITAWITYKRHKTNTILHKHLKYMRNKCREQDGIVGNLQSFLENSRSRNSGLEMPIRKLNRSIDTIEKELKARVTEVNNHESQFATFKSQWLEQAKPFINVQESVLLENMDILKVRNELTALKEYIESEMKTVKSVLEYNKALLEEAEEDVDRLFAAEGF